MKLIYITNIRLPSEKANSYQSMQMCSSFAKYFDEVELWTGRGFNTKEFSEIKDVFEYYNIGKTFLIRKFFQFDSIILKYLNEFVWANLRDFVFSVNVCLHLIRYRKSQEVLIYTRVWYLLYIFLLFKKIGLVDNKIFFESHKFSKFLLKPLSRIDGLIVINRYLYSLYEDNGLKNLLEAHDGANIDEYKHISDYKFQSKKKECNVVYTGSLFVWKGVYTLVDSLKYLPNNVKLIFVGGSDQYLVNFKKYVKDSEPKNRVTIVPHIPKKDLLQYIEIADVLVLPNSEKDKMSLYTSPIKMFEYMASKRPIVASDLPSIKEILSDQDNATLFNADNPRDLANKILNVLTNDCSKLVLRALIDVKAYSWDLRAKKIAKFIRVCPKNRILTISKTLPQVNSGSGFITKQFMNFFSEDEMIFLCEKNNQITETNSRVHFIKSELINLKRGKRFFRWQRWFLLLLLVNKIIALVKKEKCNSVMCFFPDEFHLIAATLAAKKLSIPIYPYFHNLYHENKYGFSAIIAKLVQKNLFAQAPWVYLISEGLLKELSPLYPQIDFRVLTHTTIIDEIRTNRTKPAKQKIQITFLGNINNSNIDAMSFMLNTLEQRDDVVINLITPTSKHILKKAKLVKNNVTIHSNYSDEEVSQKLRTSNLLLLPHGLTGALSDGEYRSIFPTKTIQYLLSGSPILALLPHNCYLQDFLSKNQCAFCVTSKNEQEIFSVLGHVKNHSKEIKRITNNSRKTVQIFSENKVLGKLKNQIFM